jgi:ketosteroid isomerase-like protein
MDVYEAFDEFQIRDAESRLEMALEADDPTEWVYQYAEDAVFDAGGDHVGVGRESLLTMAKSMQPVGSVSIRPLRTEGQGDLATVWIQASWVTAAAESEPQNVEVRGMILWRRGYDGRWRIAMEHIG